LKLSVQVIPQLFSYGTSHLVNLLHISNCPKEGLMKVPSLFPRALSFLAALYFPLILAVAPPGSYAQNVPTNYLQITPATGSQIGSAWFTNPTAGGTAQPQALASGFTTTFTFQFTGQGGIANGEDPYDRTGADGVAFVIQNGCFTNNNCLNTTGPFAVGPNDGLGGEIGFTGLTNSVAVQFDTWCNVSAYGDTCAAQASPTSADQITVESCGTGANTVNHAAGCQFGTVDLSTLAKPVYLADGAVHTALIKYAPANPGAGTCPPGSESGSAGCGTLTVVIDTQTVLTVPFNLAYLGLDGSDDAYVGFTGATGGSFELQNILSWNFSVTGDFSYPPFPSNAAAGLQTNGSASVVVIQTLSTTQPNISTFNPTTLVQETLDYSKVAANNLQCNIGGGQQSSCPDNLQLVSTNSVIPSGSFGSYTSGTPFSTAQCLGRPGDGTTNPCSLYVNACFGGNISQANADDFYCPFVVPGSPANNQISILDTWEPVNPKPDPSKTPGTTFSQITFSPSFAGEAWKASPLSPNPVCTNPNGTNPAMPSPPASCDISDAFVEAYGDQTTTRGSRPKKGWIISAFNVYEPLSNVSVNGVAINNPPAYNPGLSAGLWFKPPISLSFLVNPACPSPLNTASCPAGTQANNFFTPAPIAGENYAVTTLSGGPVVALTPATAPTGFNTDAVMPITFTANPTLPGGQPLPDGQYYVLYGASDNVGTDERFTHVIPGDAQGNCPIPADAGGGTLPATPQNSCYVTVPFESQLNVDGTAPTISLSGFTPTGSPAGTFGVGETAYPIYTCTDNLSGVSNCGGIPVSCPLNVSPGALTSTTPLNTSTPGNFSFNVTATDCAGNMSNSVPVNYTVLPGADTAIFELETTDHPKHGTNFTYIAWAFDLSKQNAYNVNFSIQISLPPGVLAPGGAIKGIVADCGVFTGCSAPPVTGKICTVSSGPGVGTNTLYTISCNVGTLQSVSSLKGAVTAITIPIASTAATKQFTIVATVNSAGDPNLSNNTTMDTITVK
jgi:hypothetical protein